MSKSVVAFLCSLGVVLVLVLVAIGSYVSNANYGNTAEQGIKATYANNQNILGQYTLKVQEAASVPAMYRDDLQKVMTSVLSGRYGKNGSQAVMQWIKEQNLPYDSTLYVKLQQIIEAGRNEFQTAQTHLIDEKRVYTTNLGYVWKGYWLAKAGYPKINLDDYKTITTEESNNAFKSGVEAPIKLR